MTSSHILYGMPGSLYTAKVRSYLRKRRIPFEERCPGDPRFTSEILPHTGRWIIPVLQTQEGLLLQDSTVIIDYFETLAGAAADARPANPVLAVLAHLFELFGGEGLLRPAMHYRWNFDEENLDFLRADFDAALTSGNSPVEREAIFSMASARMRNATHQFGVIPASTPTIEASYLDFLARLERHLAHAPYLLGERPTLADYGLIGPMHAHLARDPYPASLMKRIAPRVWRWVERMNAPDAHAGEYFCAAPVWLDPYPSSTTPWMLQTTEELMRFISEDYLPEITEHVRFANQWLAAHPALQAGTNGLRRPGDRLLGQAIIEWRGLPIEISIMPYRLFMLQRMQEAVARLESNDLALVRTLFERTGLAPLLSLQCRRRVLRSGHAEVWGPEEACD